MARVPFIEAADVPGELGEMLRARSSVNLLRVLPHAPVTTLGLMKFIRAMREPGGFEPKLRELAILRVCGDAQVSFEINAHAKLALELGVPQRKIDMALAGEIGEPMDAREQATLAFTDALLRQVKAPDALYHAMAAHLSPQEQLELHMVIGIYMLVSRIMLNLEVEAP